MYREVINYLNLKPGDIVVDATVGTGGHSALILKHITPGGKLIGIDKDIESINVCREQLKEFQGSYELVYSDFRDIDRVLKEININKVDAMLFDLGISSFQLQDTRRGFSFQSEGPLDMRMDKAGFISAYDLVNNLNQEEISTLLRTFGQERWHNRISRYLVKEREKSPIATTAQLADLVVKAVPYNYRYHRIHPATRTFQALRIAVNRELEALDEALNKAIELLDNNGRICAISFHSLEDRIVKLNFRKFTAQSKLKLITKKPQRPLVDEVKENPSSRSAKLRVAERIS
jgi:16S rRNA (cytosine1402-N4)-methyltransferase